MAAASSAAFCLELGQKLWHSVLLTKRFGAAHVKSCQGGVPLSNSGGTRVFPLAMLFERQLAVDVLVARVKQ